MNDGWYVVSENVTIDSRITVSGTVYLILMDGYTLTAQDGINVAAGNSLTIYGQSGQSGSLSATANTFSNNTAGIGGGYDQAGGTITINGGNVTARGGSSGAGIGGGNSGAGGIITINGGSVFATSKGAAAGIGSGPGGASAGNITINGGTVIAVANYETGEGAGAGIGSGRQSGDTGTIIINGGTVTATGATRGAGIGSGDSGGGTIIINGGFVTAKSNGAGAGIGGGGAFGAAGNITITGGTVTATGGSYDIYGDGDPYSSAGIGDSGYGSGGTITISGGTITATGGKSYGIGKGEDDSSSTTTFSTGPNGNAVIHTSNISDKTQQSSWSGVIFEGNSGKVYGNPTPTEDFEIKSGEMLNVPDGTSLTVANGVTLTNRGTIDVWGQLTNGEKGIQNEGSGKIIYHFNLNVKAPTSALLLSLSQRPRQPLPPRP